MFKVMLDKTKGHDKLVLKGAIIGQSVYGDKDLQTLSELPSLNDLRAVLAGLLVQPLQGLLGVLAAPAQGVAGVLEAGSSSLAAVLAAYAAKTDAA
jgi:large subunit ribosomal protein L10